MRYFKQGSKLALFFIYQKSENREARNFLFNNWAGSFEFVPKAGIS
jgi:hypothetical protein